MGGKNARNNFSSNKPIEQAKNVVKKIFAKKCEKTFFYIHKNIVTKKLGGKNRETIFPETQQRVRAKNVRKKSSEKSAKKRFL